MEPTSKSPKRVDRGPGPRGLTRPIAPITSDEAIKDFIRQAVGKNPEEGAWPTVETLRTKFQAGNRRVMRLREQVEAELGVSTVPRRGVSKRIAETAGLATIENFRSRMQEWVEATAELQGQSDEVAKVLEPAIKEVLREVKQLKKSLQERAVLRGPGRPSLTATADSKLYDLMASVEQKQTDLAHDLVAIRKQVVAYNTDMDAAADRLVQTAETACGQIKDTGTQVVEATGKASTDQMAALNLDFALIWNQLKAGLGDLEELVARARSVAGQDADPLDIREALSAMSNRLQDGQQQTEQLHTRLLSELRSSLARSQSKTHNYFRVLTETLEDQAEMPVTLDDYSFNVLGGIALFAPEYWNTKRISRAKSRKA